MQAVCTIKKLVAVVNTGFVGLITFTNDPELDMDMVISAHVLTGPSGLLSAPHQVWHEGTSGLQSSRDSTW